MRMFAFKRTAPAAPLGQHVPFHAAYVAQAPETPGVYILYRGHRLIYIGLAAAGATIRQCLRRHLRGEAGTCTHGATEFDYESADDPVALYQYYLGVYVDATGGLLPDCNEAH
jgi:hypothetical protein